MTLLQAARFEDRSDAENAMQELARGSTPVMRRLLIHPSSPSQGLRPASDTELPAQLRARRFDGRIARGSAAGAIVLGTGLAILLWPMGLPFLGTVIGAGTGAVLGLVLAAMSAPATEHDAFKLLLEAAPSRGWLVLVEVETAEQASSIRQTLIHCRGELVDP
ncbi:MAG: hypothetical protein EA398_04390 [Deltaproteobacteria bacterium]|nr:MAG: hypothetical protein EA398_04390 [Deltaproteobacteria bacterium]